MFTINRHSVTMCSLLLVTALVWSGWGGRAAAQTGSPTLVQVIDTSKWPSPDPSGITYWPSRDQLVIVDGEVDEMPIFAGANLFIATRAGQLTGGGDTRSFTPEPVGIDIEIDPETNQFFISDDSKKTIWVITLGADGKFGTSDDTRRSFASPSGDPEGLTFGKIGGQKRLFTVDGLNTKVWVTNPGSDGIFGTADDSSASFDVGLIGVRDPEGIDYDPNTGTLYVVDRSGAKLFEITTNGALVRSVDLRQFFVPDPKNPENLRNEFNPADVTLAPGSTNRNEQHLYIVQRGVDNNDYAQENDGKIYELTLGGGSTPTPSPTPSPTPTPSPQPGGNLLVNPGFETANTKNQPTGWSTNAKFTRDTTTFNSGSASGKFFATDNTGPSVTQKVAVRAGTTYNVNGWVNIPAQNDGTFSLQVQVTWKDAGNVTVGTVQKVATYTNQVTNGWTQFTKSVPAPTGATSAIVTIKTTSLNGNIYVDDVSFGP